MKKKQIILASIVVVLLGVIAFAYFISKQSYPIGLLGYKERPTHGECLKDDEVAEYVVEQNPEGGGVAKISIKDKNSKEEKFNFSIKISSPDHYHPVEIHRCGIYAMRTFGYDYKKNALTKDYRREFWKYNYDKKGKSLLKDSAKWSYENMLSDFRVSPDEKYIFLIKSYLGKDDYALVIKDLNTKEDVDVLKLKDILEKHPDVMPGSIGLGIFTPNGKYFWGDIYDGARETAYYRIEMGTWKTDILPLPEDIPVGVERAWSFGGWVAYADIPSFSGFAGVVEQMEKEAREKGEKKTLTVYNLFTKEKKVISSADPSHRFKPDWISDTKLEYTLPSGEKKVYDAGAGEGK